MSDKKQELADELHAARDLHEKNVQALREILELLEKADARRKANPDDVRRWNEVLDHLENSLTQARARVSASEHRLKMARRALQEALGNEALQVAEASHQTASVSHEGSTFETRLEKVIGAENAAAALNDDKVAERPLATGKEEATPGASTGQQALQSAINKIQQHRVHSLDADEVKATIAAYERLSGIPSPNLKDQRLMRILGAAVRVFQRTARRKQ